MTSNWLNQSILNELMDDIVTGFDEYQNGDRDCEPYAIPAGGEYLDAWERITNLSDIGEEQFVLTVAYDDCPEISKLVFDMGWILRDSDGIQWYQSEIDKGDIQVYILRNTCDIKAEIDSLL